MYPSIIKVTRYYKFDLLCHPGGVHIQIDRLSDKNNNVTVCRCSTKFQICKHRCLFCTLKLIRLLDQSGG